MNHDQEKLKVRIVMGPSHAPFVEEDGPAEYRWDRILAAMLALLAMVALIAWVIYQPAPNAGEPAAGQIQEQADQELELSPPVPDSGQAVIQAPVQPWGSEAAEPEQNPAVMPDAAATGTAASTAANTTDDLEIVFPARPPRRRSNRPATDRRHPSATVAPPRDGAQRLGTVPG